MLLLFHHFKLQAYDGVAFSLALELVVDLSIPPLALSVPLLEHLQYRDSSYQPTAGPMLNRHVDSRDL